MNPWILAPEIYYLAAAGVFFLRSLGRASRPDRGHGTAVALAAAGIAVCLAAGGLRGEAFVETYRVDLFSQSFKGILAIGLLLTLFLCRPLAGVAEDRHPEFYLLLFLCTLSMMMLVSGVHLLNVYLSLEVSSYSLYVLVFLGRDREKSAGTALRYFLTGACASAVMLLGIALLYGTTRAVYLEDLAAVLPHLTGRPAALVGLLLALSGLLFKLAVFPFHFWAPDVYEGAAHPVAAYIATVSKAAAIGALVRVVAAAGGHADLTLALAVLSVAAMTVGNLTALAQEDLKRLLAGSSIAHGGYVLLGILCAGRAGAAAAVFYAAALVAMKFTCFLAVVRVSPAGGNPRVRDLAGLHRRSPGLALALMLALFGLCGIPPTVGFTGKLFVFLAAMDRGFFWLVLAAMANVVVSLVYYLRVLRAAYLLEPAPGEAPPPPSGAVRALAALLVAAMVYGGIHPTPLLELARRAVEFLP